MSFTPGELLTIELFVAIPSVLGLLKTDEMLWSDERVQHPSVWWTVLANWLCASATIVSPIAFILTMIYGVWIRR